MRGGARPNAGRKPREVEQDLVNRLTEYKEDVFEALHEAIKQKRQWAIQLWFERMYGKAKDFKELDITTNQLNIPPIFFKSTDEINKEHQLKINSK